MEDDWTDLGPELDVLNPGRRMEEIMLDWALDSSGGVLLEVDGGILDEGRLS